MQLIEYLYLDIGYLGIGMEHAERLRSTLNDLSERRASSKTSKGAYQPWSQIEYCKRLYSFHPLVWTARNSACECTVAALYGWSSTDQKDKLICSLCGASLQQPWITGMTTDLEQEMEQSYRQEFREGHKPPCLWRSGSCPEGLQFLTIDNGSDQLSKIKDRIERLRSLDFTKFDVPPEHDFGPAETLAILGWDRSSSSTINCIFGCCSQIEIDEQFHPILEHRWCCPVVHLDPARKETSGWKYLLSIYKKNTK